MLCKECQKAVFGAQIQKGTGMCKKCYLRIKVEDGDYIQSNDPHEMRIKIDHPIRTRAFIPKSELKIENMAWPRSLETRPIPKIEVPPIPDLALMESLAKSVQDVKPQKRWWEFWK